MADSHKNFAYSTVATPPSPAASGGSLIVATGDGAKFPTPPFNAVVWPANDQPSSTNAEIVRVTAGPPASDTFTITRAQEGSSARTIVAGDRIDAAVTVKTITDVEAILGQAPPQITDPGTATTESDLVLPGDLVFHDTFTTNRLATDYSNATNFQIVGGGGGR